MAVTALIVDDSAVTRQIIAYHLRDTHCTVVGEAENAAEGLRLFRELKPDIVTVDLMMPEKDQIDATNFIKAMKKERRGVVIIVISIISFDRTVQTFRDQGVFAYIVKPFNDFSFKAVQLKLRRLFPELAAAS